MINRFKLKGLFESRGIAEFFANRGAPARQKTQENSMDSHIFNAADVSVGKIKQSVQFFKQPRSNTAMQRKYGRRPVFF